MKPETTPAIIGPCLVLILLVACLPVTLPLPTTGRSSDDCLILADAPPEQPAGNLDMLKRCSALLPADAELAGDLGRAYEAAGDLARAEAAYRQALAIDGDYADVRLRLGWLLLHRGAVTEARAEATTALRIQPGRPALIELLQAAQGGPAGHLP